MTDRQKSELKEASGRFQKVMNLLSLLLLTGMFLFLLLFWGKIPDRIPIHYGFDGTADGFGSKGTLFLLPVMGLVIHLLLSCTGRFPSCWNLPVQLTPFNKKWVYRNVKNLFSILKFQVMLVYFYLTVCCATQRNVGWIPLLLIGSAFVSLLFFIHRIRKAPPSSPEDHDVF